MTYIDHDGNVYEHLDENGQLYRPAPRTAHYTNIWDICDHKIPDWRLFKTSEYIAAMGNTEQAIIDENDNNDIHKLYTEMLFSFASYCRGKSYDWLGFEIEFKQPHQLASMYNAVFVIIMQYLNLIKDGVTPEYGMFPTWDKMRV